MTTTPDTRMVAIATDAADRVAKNAGIAPQLAFAPILFALQDAAPAQSEAGEGAAWAWLESHVECNPADRDYSADEMVDAFMEGARRYDRLAKALERIAAGQQYRSGYCQTDIAVEPALTADEAQAVAREALRSTPAREEGGGAVELLKRLKSSLMHVRRFGVDDLATWRRGCTSTEGDIEEWLIDNGHQASDQRPALTPREEAPAEVGERGTAGVIMDGLWPILGGNHMDVKVWNEIGEVVLAALRAQPQAREEAGAVAWIEAGDIDHVAEGNPLTTTLFPYAKGDAVVALYAAPPSPDADKLRADLAAALEAVKYQPGDHPVVPIKHDQFVKTVARLAATPAEGARTNG